MRYVLHGDRASVQHEVRSGDREEMPRGEEGPPRQATSQSNPSSSPSAMDVIGLMAAGIKQFQEAQVNMMKSKAEKDEEKVEVVKPGVTTLPELKGPNPETSPIDIIDGLSGRGPKVASWMAENTCKMQQKAGIRLLSFRALATCRGSSTVAESVGTPKCKGCQLSRTFCCD